jgi:hypothetical protein
MNESSKLSIPGGCALSGLYAAQATSLYDTFEGTTSGYDPDVYQENNLNVKITSINLLNFST